MINSLTTWTVRLMVVFVFLLTVNGLALAQTYSVLVTQNTNLRASYSLQSGIVETVAAGTTLQVGGSFNRWLSNSRNGEVWMADWVPYDRVESAQTPSDVNNCCFVNRQCTTDQEWTDGYWAYRRNECPAPAQSPQQTSPQPMTSTPAIVDNCCFVNRQCATEQEWTNGYWAYQRNECSAPTQSPQQTSPQPMTSTAANIDNCCFINRQCTTDAEWQAGYRAYRQDNQCLAAPLPTAHNTHSIRIEGSTGFRRQVIDGLDLLRNKVSHWYRYVVSRIRKVKQDRSQDYVYADVAKRTMVMDFRDHPPPDQPYHEHVNFIAQALVHEACHMDQDASGVEGEIECVEVELKATIEYAPTSRWVAESREVLAELYDELD